RCPSATKASAVEQCYGAPPFRLFAITLLSGLVARVGSGSIHGIAIPASKVIRFTPTAIFCSLCLITELLEHCSLLLFSSASFGKPLSWLARETLQIIDPSRLAPRWLPLRF